MTINIGEVTTFPHPKADKSQVLKIAEEYSEVYSAWENLQEVRSMYHIGNATYQEVEYRKKFVIDECADMLTAICNLLIGLGVDNQRMKRAMQDCEQRNRDRGRL